MLKDQRRKKGLSSSTNLLTEILLRLSEENGFLKEKTDAYESQTSHYR